MEKEIRIIYEEYIGLDSLSEKDRELVLRARQAVNTSYSPYSKFRVGSSLRLSSGEIIDSSNQENMSYPLGLCAERLGLFYAGTRSYPVEAIAVVACDEKGIWSEAYPCGACLSVMLETELRYNKPLRIIVQKNSTQFEIFKGVNSLMPFSFKLHNP